MKKRELSRLLKLYLSYHLNKVVIILLTLIIAIWVAVLILESGVPFDLGDYYLESRSFHHSYLSQTLFFMKILNGVIVAFLVGAEMTSISGFDPMFVSNISRTKIVAAKLLSNLILIFLFVLFEVLLLYMVASICYPAFRFQLTNLLIVFQLILPLIELLLLGEFISILFNNYFVPILIFIIDLLEMIVAQNLEDKSLLATYIPQVSVQNSYVIFDWNGFIYGFIVFV